MRIKASDPDLDVGMAHGDHIAIGKQPIINRRLIHRGAIGGLQIHQHRILAVPGDFRVLAGYASIRQAQVRVIAAADNIGAFLHVINA